MSYLEINNLEKFMLPWNETKFPKIIDDVDMKKGCIELVKNFNREGLDLDFAEKGLEYTIPTVDRLVNHYNQHKREELLPTFCITNVIRPFSASA